MRPAKHAGRRLDVQAEQRSGIPPNFHDSVSGRAQESSDGPLQHPLERGMCRLPKLGGKF